MWHFFTITAQLTLQQCLQHILSITYSTIYNYTTQYTNCAVYIYFPFHNVNIFPRLLYNCLFHYVYSEASLDTYSTVYKLLSPVYCLCCLYMLSFSQCDIFSQLLHNWLYNNVYSISLAYTYSTIYNYTTQYTNCAVYICFLYTMWYFSSITAQMTLQQCLQHILNIYIQYCSQLHYPVNCHCYYIGYPFHNVIFFHNDCTIHSTTMFTAYPQHIHTVLFTITLPSILTVLFTYAILYTMWHFFTMTAQFTLQQCLQHILNIYIQYCSQLHYPVYWLCSVYMLPLHNVTFFNNYCTSDSTTMSIAYPQHIHIVLFTTTLHSILALLFIYASFTQCDIFSQLLHNWLYNNVYSISSTYTCGTVYNYTTQYADF